MKIEELTVVLIETKFKRQLSYRDRYFNLFNQLIYQLVHSTQYSDARFNHFINHFGRIFFKDLDIRVTLLQSYDGLSVKETDSIAIFKKAKSFAEDYEKSKADLVRLLKTVEFNIALLYPDIFELALEDMNDPYYPLGNSFKKLSDEIARYRLRDHVILVNAMDIRAIERTLSVIAKKLYVLMRKIQFSDELLGRLNNSDGRIDMLYRIQGPSQALRRELYNDPNFADSNIEYCIKHIESVYVLPDGKKMKSESIRRVINRYKKNESRTR